MDAIAHALYGPPWLSLLTTVVGNAVFVAGLLLVVIATRRLRPAVRWGARGAAFGAVVLPLSLWLYAQFFAGPLRALVFGFPGLFLLLHWAPFDGLGPVSHKIVVDQGAGAASVLRSTYLAGTALWVSVYGLLGLAVGSITERRRRAVAGA